MKSHHFMLQSLVFALIALNFGSAVSAQYILQDEDVEVRNGVIISCTYNLEQKDIIIPDTLDGQSIIAIDDGDGDYYAGVFSHRGLRSLVLPSTLEYIGEFAFTANALTHVDFSKSTGLISIGFYAFNNNSLDSLDLSSCVALSSIGSSSFTGNQLTGLLLPESIESIGWKAFSSNKLRQLDLSICDKLVLLENHVFSENELSMLELPLQLEVIGENAFSDNLLTNIDLSSCSGLVSIRRNAFLGNDLLSGFRLPIHAEFGEYGWNDGLDNFFKGGDLVDNLETSYYVPAPYRLLDSDVRIEGGIMRTCSYASNLSVIVIPDTLDGQCVTGIGIVSVSSSVLSNIGVTQIIFPSTLERIGYGALRNGNLVKVDLSACPSLSNIGEYAFIGNQIRSVKLSESIERIEYRAFAKNELTRLDVSSCMALVHIESSAFISNRLTSVVLPQSLETLGNNAFSDNMLENIDLSTCTSLRHLGNQVFSGNDSLMGFYLPVHSELSHFGWKDGSDQLYDGGDWVSNLETSYFIPAPYTLKATDVEIRDGIIRSCSYDYLIKDIVIPAILDGQAVRGIADQSSGSNDLFRSKGITSVAFPSSFERIGNYSFSFNNLDSIDLSACKALSYIGESAFLGNESLKGIVLPVHEAYNNYGWNDNQENSFSGGDQVKNLETFYYIPAPYTLTDADVWVMDGIIQWCSYDFSLKMIIIPDTLDHQLVTGIADKGYDTGIFGKKGLKSIVLPASLIEIGDHAFVNNELTSIEFPVTLKEVGDRAFYSNKISDIVFPPSIERIGDWAFYFNELAEVDFSSCHALSSIGEVAFNRNHLTELDLSSCLALTSIGEVAFGYNEIVSADLSSCTALTSIGNAAFSENLISQVDLSSCTALSSIGRRAFSDNEISSLELSACRALLSIGDEAFQNNRLTNIDLSSNEALNLIGARAFHNNKLTHVLLPPGLHHLLDQVFQDNDLTGIDFSSCHALSSIGERAFFANNLQGVDLDSCTSLMYIGRGAFDGNDSVHHLILPVNTEKEVFAWKDSLANEFRGGDTVDNFMTYYYVPAPYTLTDADVELRDGVILSCFYDFKIKAIIVPDSLHGQAVCGIADQSWASGVFYEKGLVSIDLPSTLRHIGNYAFSGNDLSGIALPDSLESIGDHAFYDNSLSVVDFPGTLESIGAYAFFNNTLSSVDLSACQFLGSIGNSAFDGNELTALDLTFCTSLTSIGREAFYDNDLSNVLFPPALEIIGAYAFSGNKLNKIDLSSQTSLSYIGSKAFYNNPSSLGSFVLPVHRSHNEYGWKDGYDYMHEGGEEVSDLNPFFYVPAIYTLRDEDVVVKEGVIQACTYNFAFRRILIPEILDGQTVLGIADRGPDTGSMGVFGNRGILSVSLPSTLKSIGTYAFTSNRLKVLDLGSSKALTYIGGSAFSGNSLVLKLPSPEVEGYSFEHWIDGEGNIYQGGEVGNNNSIEYRAVLNATFRILITVRDENGPIEGALVSLDGYGSMISDSAGRAVFAGILPEDEIAYTISAVGYDAVSGFISVSYGDVSQKVELGLITYLVQFRVTDKETNPVEAAVISFADYGTLTTDPSGNATFSEVRPESDLAYQVSAPGYQDQNGSVSITDADVQIGIILTPLTGISEVEENMLLIYPNPAREAVYIQLKKAATVRMLDMSGREGFIRDFNAGMAVIPVDHLDAGEYIIHVRNRDRVFTEKVIVK